MVIGFDLDGTLLHSFSSDPLPGVRERLAALPAGTRTFVATNQAGPVFRLVTGDAKYPTVAQLAEQIAAGFRALDWHPDLLLICVHPGKDGDDWPRAAEDVSIDLRDALVRANIGPCYWAIYSQPRYRKPATGMLDDALVFFGVRESELAYVGDMASDEQAARAAGARYCDAARWRAGEF